MCRSKSVAYFAHDPAHRLLPAASDGDADAGGEFTCGGCRVAGAGRRYRCGSPSFGFTIHEACARRSPRTLRSALHPQHRLKRRRESAAGAGVEGACRCDVCGEDVKGACYACAACRVAVHPLCARLPGVVARGAAHPEEGHEAWLVRVSSSASPAGGDGKKQEAAASGCAACGRPVGAWRYRCATCGAELHPRCLVPAADQCRGEDGEVKESAAKSCCFGLLDQVANCMAITGFGYYYRFQK